MSGMELVHASVPYQVLHFRSYSFDITKFILQAVTMHETGI